MAFLRQMPLFRPFWPLRRASIEGLRFTLPETDRGDLQDLALTDRVRNAFETDPPNPTEIQVLRALLENPGATALELSRACGWIGTTWQVYLATMCRRRRDLFWPGEAAAAETGIEITAIAEYDAVSSRFRLHDDLDDFFRRMVA
ncbi:hypothetical protein [Pseudooceanicola aestuarii]|uniref:hypothetical protein n=1 Tax=Pseudooceanicola aestuarii TaxID=2697319 RepID=UPI0013D51BC6|nr:hypothetical protein [Pseudooceanicola aestuarii]